MILFSSMFTSGAAPDSGFCHLFISTLQSPISMQLVPLAASSHCEIVFAHLISCSVLDALESSVCPMYQWSLYVPPTTSFLAPFFITCSQMLEMSSLIAHVVSEQLDHYSLLDQSNDSTILECRVISCQGIDHRVARNYSYQCQWCHYLSSPQ